MLIYLVVYSFMQLGAFAVIVMMRRHDVIGDELKDLSGLYLRQPFAAFAMLMFMLSLGGIPPTAGFMGKFWLFGAAIDSGYVWLAVIGVLEQRDLALLLHPHRRLHVSEEGDCGFGADAVAGAGVHAGRCGRGDARARRLSASAVRGGRSLGAHARRRRHRRGDPLARRGVEPTESTWHTRTAGLVKFFTRYVILRQIEAGPGRFQRVGDNGALWPRRTMTPVAASLVPQGPFRTHVQRAGPAAAASYTLIGALLLLGGIGYALDRWRGTSPWFLLGGLLLGIIVGFYELAKTVWQQMNAVVAMAGASVASALVVGALVDPRARLEVLLGMVGPLARGERLVGAGRTHLPRASAGG